VRGPSTTPRPPQGQPIVAALAHDRVPFAAGRQLGRRGVRDPAPHQRARAILAKISAAEAEVGRTGAPLRITADLVVLLDDTQAGADARLRDLDRLAGAQPRSGSEVVATTPSGLADLMERWRHAGLLHGFRLRPSVLPDDLHAVVEAWCQSCNAEACSAPATKRNPARAARSGQPASRYAKLANAQRRTPNWSRHEPRGQADHPGAYFPGVNHDTVERPGLGQSHRLRLLAHWARTAERGTLDLLFLAEGLRLRDEAEPYSTRT